MPSGNPDLQVTDQSKRRSYTKWIIMIIKGLLFIYANSHTLKIVVSKTGIFEYSPSCNYQSFYATEMKTKNVIVFQAFNERCWKVFKPPSL